MLLDEQTKTQVWNDYGVPLLKVDKFFQTGMKCGGSRSRINNIAFWKAYYSALSNFVCLNEIDEPGYMEKKWLGHQLQAYFRKEVPNDSIDNLFDDIENFNNLTGEENMNPVEPKRASATCDEPAFEIRKLAFGRNIERMGADELIDTVRRFEREIESLKAIKTESKHIAKRIADLELGLKEVVQLLDSKE